MSRDCLKSLHKVIFYPKLLLEFDGGLKCRIHSLLGILILLLILPSAQQFSLGIEKNKYTYYGVIPSRLYLYRPYKGTHGICDISKGWHIDKNWNTSEGLIVIIGAEEETHVEVYIMPGWKLIKRLTLGPLEKSLITLPNGTIFKVSSDKPVGVFGLLEESESRHADGDLSSIASHLLSID